MYNLVIFDFDGTIFDTYDAIEHSIQLTFQQLLPSHPTPCPATSALSDTFRSLHPDPTTFDESAWITTYRGIYDIHGQSQTRPYPAARQVLESLHARKVPIAIISNKVAVAVKAALEKTDLLQYFPDSLILGQGLAGVQRKPDPSSFTEVLWPNLQALGTEGGLDVSKVLMVGDTLTDIHYAKNIGVKSCWCRYGQGDPEECERLEPDHIIDTFEDVLKVVEGTI
ncbi:HAD-like protein [Aspergillus sclerotioniger CBS 115572]|uniref:HAD-like protein n=1 Tax=Aspergillus sclerotioniger CBS 115572 TaxID=1450535 RepID=A0A317VNM8_9EURO|nr:HAD-like protein [Aspergillus sclerotioniger CBS 115572]PWY75199.1 HAD-like protein [Aspergillus sclerotioniger CBS 115572]